MPSEVLYNLNGFPGLLHFSDCALKEKVPQMARSAPFFLPQVILACEEPHKADYAVSVDYFAHTDLPHLFVFYFVFTLICISILY